MNQHRTSRPVIQGVQVFLASRPPWHWTNLTAPIRRLLGLALLLALCSVFGPVLPAHAAEAPPTFVASIGNPDSRIIAPQSIAVDSAGNIYVLDSNYQYVQKFTSAGIFVTQWGSYGSDDGQFIYPNGIATDSVGNVYVADTYNQRIQKFTSAGIFVTQWGSAGSDDGQFAYPNGIAVDSAGNVYVLDTYNYRIQKFDSVGGYLTQWGSGGSDDGQFTNPLGIALDSTGNVYVVDPGSQRIQKFDSAGVFVTKWGSSYGSGDGQFANPLGIATDSAGNVYVADTNNQRIQKFTSAGGFVMKLDNSGDGQFANPADIATDSAGNVYVADTDNQRIQKFDSAGGFVTKWGSAGSGDGQFANPQGIATDSTGNVYVVDTDNYRIQKFTSAGIFVMKWGSVGNGDGQFANPNGIAIDSTGHIYVADTDNQRIQKFDSAGGFVTKWGSGGSGDSQFATPAGIAVDSAGHIYVADTYNQRIQKFDSAGGFVTQWGSAGNGDGQFAYPQGIATDSAGSVYVVDTVNYRIQKFDSAGGFVTKWGNYGSGDGQFVYPNGIATDSAGHVYVADTGNQRFQKFSTLPAPNLSIPTSQISAAQGSFSVPVNFVRDGASIASVGFSLNYDPICLSFDAAHSGASASLSNAFAAAISHNTAGQLELSLFDDVGPIATLADGPLFNLAFTVNDSCITKNGTPTNVAFSFASTPAVSFGDVASVDVVGTATGATIPLHFNATPTALNLTNSSVDENAISGTAVGTLSTSDPDTLDSHTYTLVSVDSNVANPGFVLDGTTLKTSAVFDFETKSSYVVRILTTDNGGLNGTLERDFTINVTDLIEAPASIATTDGSNSDGNPNTIDLNENAPAGAVVATLKPSNPDATNSYTYAFVEGPGNADNPSFTLDGNTLKANASLDYETKPSYTVRIRITDSHNNVVDQIIVITVNNRNDAPVAVDDALSTILLGGTTTTLDVLANDSDQDHNPFSVSAVTQPGSGSVTNNGSNVSFLAPNGNGSPSFTYQASDGLLSSSSASVNLSYVKNDPRGDCNSNGSVTAADFIGTVLEIFDSSDTKVSSHPAWWLIYTGTYAGSPLGCDSNVSKNGDDHTLDSVGAGDITCTVLLFFGRFCGTTIVSAASTPAQMNVVDVSATPGENATVQVNFTPAGNNVAATTLALTIDPSQLGFDATDADTDGIPDAVVLNVPASMAKSVTWNAAQSRLEVAVFGTSLPLPSLMDGPLATVSFQVVATASGTSELGLQLVTLGDPEGQDLTVNASHGTLTVTGDAATPRKFLFLPVIMH